jgi:hypothetical protein
LNTAVIPGLEPTQRPQQDRKPQDRRGGGRQDSRGSVWGQDRRPQGRFDAPRGDARRGDGFRPEGFRSEGFKHEGPRRDGFKADGFARPQGKPAPRKGPVQVRSGKPDGARAAFKPRAR